MSMYANRVLDIYRSGSLADLLDVVIELEQDRASLKMDLECTETCWKRLRKNYSDLDELYQQLKHDYDVFENGLAQTRAYHERIAVENDILIDQRNDAREESEDLLRQLEVSERKCKCLEAQLEDALGITD